MCSAVTILYEDPRAVLEANGITEIPVYFEPENIKNHLVDMSVLDKYAKGKGVHLQSCPLQTHAACISAPTPEKRDVSAMDALFPAPRKVNFFPAPAAKKIIPLDETRFSVASL